MKLLSPHMCKRRERIMLARARKRIRILQDCPTFFDTLSPLILMDILMIWSLKMLSDEEADLVRRACLRSKATQEVFDRLTDAQLWSQTKEGRQWIKSTDGLVA